VAPKETALGTGAPARLPPATCFAGCYRKESDSLTGSEAWRSGRVGITPSIPSTVFKGAQLGMPSVQTWSPGATLPSRTHCLITASSRGPNLWPRTWQYHFLPADAGGGSRLPGELGSGCEPPGGAAFFGVVVACLVRTGSRFGTRATLPHFGHVSAWPRRESGTFISSPHFGHLKPIIWKASSWVLPSVTLPYGGTLHLG